MTIDEWINQQIEWCRVPPFEFKHPDGERFQIFPPELVSNVPDDCIWFRSMATGKELALRIVGQYSD